MRPCEKMFYMNFWISKYLEIASFKSTFFFQNPKTLFISRFKLDFVMQICQICHPTVLPALQRWSYVLIQTDVNTQHPLFKLSWWCYLYYINLLGFLWNLKAISSKLVCTRLIQFAICAYVKNSGCREDERSRMVGEIVFAWKQSSICMQWSRLVQWSMSKINHLAMMWHLFAHKSDCCRQ